jgi:hypothetical protein
MLLYILGRNEKRFPWDFFGCKQTQEHLDMGDTIGGHAVCE